jgi:hypothetical protein
MRRVFVALAAVTVIAAVGVVMATGGRSSPADSSSPQVPSYATPSSGEPATTDGDAPDLDGAARAAVAAVASTGDVATAGFISRRDLIARFATREFGPSLADSTSEQMQALATELGERDVAIESMAVVERPISATASATPAGARVDVYSVLIVAVPGMGPARQVWRTVSLDMVWSDGRWLVDGWDSTAGPTPALAAEAPIASADDVATHLAWDRTSAGD